MDEHRAIEEEARNAGLSDAGEKVQAIRDSNAQANAAAGTPITTQQLGRDSGFCSEQDQHAQQGGFDLSYHHWIFKNITGPFQVMKPTCIQECYIWSGTLEISA